MAVSGLTTHSPITARSSDFRWRRSAAFVLGTAGLAIVLSFFLDGKVPVTIAHGERVGLYSGHPSRLTAKPVPECGAIPEGRQKVTKLELTGEDGLQFKCAADQTLHPPAKSQDKNDFSDVYEYDPTKGTCTGDAKALSSVVNGAKLTKSEQKSQPAARTMETVYTLKYTEEPAENKSLCYTCKTSLGPVEDAQSRQQAGECTVHIAVKAKTPPSPPGDTQQGSTPAPPGTTPPTSTSDTRRITASAAAAAAATFLPVAFFL